MTKRKNTTGPELYLPRPKIFELSYTPKQRWQDVCDAMPSGTLRYVGLPLYTGADVAIVAGTNGPTHLFTNGSLHDYLIEEINARLIRKFWKVHRPKGSVQVLICARFHNTPERQFLAGNRLHWLDKAGRVMRTDRYHARFGLFEGDEWGEYPSCERIFDASQAGETTASLAEFTEQCLFGLNLAGRELNFDAILWLPAEERSALPYFVSTSPDPLAWRTAMRMIS